LYPPLSGAETWQHEIARINAQRQVSFRDFIQQCSAKSPDTPKRLSDEGLWSHISGMDEQAHDQDEPQPVAPGQTVEAPAGQPREIGGPKGPEPTRYGDWQYNGRCTDF